MAKRGPKPQWVEALTVQVGQSIDGLWTADAERKAWSKAAVGRLAINAYFSDMDGYPVLPTVEPGEPIVRSVIQISPEQQSKVKLAAETLQVSPGKVGAMAVAFLFHDYDLTPLKIYVPAGYNIGGET